MLSKLNQVFGETLGPNSRFRSVTAGIDVHTCPEGHVHPGVQGPGRHWVLGHKSSQVYGQDPEQSLYTCQLGQSAEYKTKKHSKQTNKH